MRPTFEVADIFRRHGGPYTQENAGHLGRGEQRVMGAIEACRTPRLGGHVDACDDCGKTRISYNSCRNRHCPKCQGAARKEWVDARIADLLPVPYFHVVFTLPRDVAEIAFQNKAVVYGLLMRISAETLQTIAANPKWLGAEIGVTAVLHTWGQAMTHHPHVHCVVPGGGLSPDRTRWINCRSGFFLPVSVLSRLFRRLFLTALAGAFAQGELQFFNELTHLNDSNTFTSYLARTRSIEWVVYSKPPFGGPGQVLAYLGRYTHRVAIANSRMPMATMSPSDGRIIVATAVTVRRSCAFIPTSLCGAFSCMSFQTAFTACATSAFSPTATGVIVSASAGASSANQHQQAGNLIRPNRSRQIPTNAPTAGGPCVELASP